MNKYDRNTIIARKCGCGSSGDVKVETNITPIELSYDLEMPTNFIKGLDGKSAYQSALEAGYIGTEEDFYNNLKKAGEDIKLSDITFDNSELGLTAEDVLVGKDILVTSPIGSYSVGDTISASHSLYDVLLMLVKSGYEIPTYVMPIIDRVDLVTSKPIEEIEVGDTVTLDIYVNYLQNDAGATKSVKYYINDLLIGTSATTDTHFVKQHKFTEQHNVLKVVVSYSDGNIRTDGEGRAYEKGRIKAGEIESTLEVEAYNLMNTLFMGTMNEEITKLDINDDTIKSLQYKIDDPKQGMNKYIMRVPDGSKSIIIAYPARLGMIHDIRNLRTSINEVDAFEENFFQMVLVGEDRMNTKYNVYFFTSTTELDNLTYDIMI